MKSKLIPILSTALLLSGAMVSVASAQGVANIHANANADVEVHAQGNSTSTAAQAAIHGNATSSATKTTVRGNATSTAAKGGTHGNATSTNAKASGQLTPESQRSAVASFVQSLLAVANREGGIGKQVRAVAMSEQDSASTSANAIAKVEGVGGLHALFLGSDYHSLGQLRSEMATTSANIAKLKDLLSNATSDSDKAELSAQIQVLEDSQAQVAAFVQSHESQFSFFGWFTKIFAQ